MATQHDQAAIVAASGPASARHLVHCLLALACVGAAPCAIGQAVPGIPTIGSAVAGDAQATVTFTAPDSDGNSAISIYTATSDPGGISATSSVNYPGAFAWELQNSEFPWSQALPRQVSSLMDESL
jgi:hypothetical protein